MDPAGCSHGRREGKDHAFGIAFLSGRELWVAIADLAFPPASVHIIILSLISSREGFPGHSVTHVCILFLLLAETLWLEWAVGSCYIGRVFEVLFRL